MNAIQSRFNFTLVLVVATFFLGLFAEDAEAARRGRRGFRRGGAARVSARRPPVRRGPVRVVSNRNAGVGRNVVRRNNFNNNAGVFNVAGVAIDETGLAGFANNGVDNNNQQFQQVFLNGQGLRIARGSNGQLFALRDDALNANGVLVDNSVAAVASTDPLLQIANGQVMSGFDSRGRALNSSVIRDIQIFNSGGRVR